MCDVSVVRGGVAGTAEKGPLPGDINPVNYGSLGLGPGLLLAFSTGSRAGAAN